ncbi:MAG TPA: mismatch-specific DNA-glycosylase [Bacillota bacterium]
MQPKQNPPEPVVPNLVRPGLKILFVGINPGLRSAAIGHNFAGHSNRFWRFLFQSGLTLSQFDALHDRDLLELGYGITNIVSRSTATAAELTRVDFEAGGRVLLDLLSEYRPRIAAYLGKDIYRYLSETSHLDWGLQPQRVVMNVVDFILPNPSGLNRIPLPEQLHYYVELKKLSDRLEKASG